MTAAVVNPFTSFRSAGCKITPAPRNPIPVTIPCTVLNAPDGSLPAIAKLTNVNSAAPTATIACVRIPAGLWWMFRLSPTTAPHKAAAPMRWTATHQSVKSRGAMT